MKFKVGDKVRMKDMDMKYKYGYIPQMDNFINKTHEIKTIIEDKIFLKDAPFMLTENEVEYVYNKFPIETYFEGDYYHIDEERLVKERSESFNNLNSDVFDLQYLKNYANRWEGKVFINFTHSGNVNPLDVASFVNGYITTWNKTNYHGFPFGCKVIQTNHREYIVQHYKGE